MSDQAKPLANIDAEAGLLGAVLISGLEVLEYPKVKALTLADFWDEKHRDVWAAIGAVVDKGLVPDCAITVPDELEKRGQLADVGGQAALVRMMNACPSYVNAESYADIVRDYSDRRRDVRTATQLVKAAHRDGPYHEARQQALEALAETAIRRFGPVESRTIGEIRLAYGDVLWAWPGRIPCGHLTLIAGPQDSGKSWFAAYLAAVETGHIEHWPDGTPYAGQPGTGLPAKVLLVETEEMRGAYAERLERMGVGDHWVIVGPGGDYDIPDLLKQADSIERLARDEAVGMIIVDSLSGGHTIKEESAVMRQLLKRYARMAATLKIPIVLVHHTRKRRELESTKVTLDRVRGSTTITQFCRSVLALYRLDENDQSGPVRVESIKSTFCQSAEALGFTIGDDGLTFVDAPEPVRIESQMDKACDLLKALLTDGPMLSTELMDEAAGAGISRATLYRAKDNIGVVARRDGKARKWSWALPARQKPLGI